MDSFSGEASGISANRMDDASRAENSTQRDDIESDRAIEQSPPGRCDAESCGAHHRCSEGGNEANARAMRFHGCQSRTFGDAGMRKRRLVGRGYGWAGRGCCQHYASRRRRCEEGSRAGRLTGNEETTYCLERFSLDAYMPPRSPTSYRNRGNSGTNVWAFMTPRSPTGYINWGYGVLGAQIRLRAWQYEVPYIMPRAPTGYTDRGWMLVASGQHPACHGASHAPGGKGERTDVSLHGTWRSSTELLFCLFLDDTLFILLFSDLETCFGLPGLPWLQDAGFRRCNVREPPGYFSNESLYVYEISKSVQGKKLRKCGRAGSPRGSTA